MKKKIAKIILNQVIKKVATPENAQKILKSPVTKKLLKKVVK